MVKTLLHCTITVAVAGVLVMAGVASTILKAPAQAYALEESPVAADENAPEQASAPALTPVSEDTMANNLPVSLVPPALLGNPTPQPTPSPAVRLPSAGATTAGDQSQSVAGVGTVNPSPIRPTATKPPAAVLLPEAYQPQPRFLRFGMPPLLLYGITTLDPAVARYLYAGAVVTGLMGLYLILSALTLPRLLMPARSLNRISL